MYVVKTLDTTLLLRFDSYEKLLSNYNNRQIVFSCPANWLNLALKNFNSRVQDIYKENVGDVLECAFAKIYTKDFKPENYVDHYGKPLGGNLLMVNTNDGKTYLFCQQRVLTPALCFYSISGSDIFNQNPKPICSEFQLQQYARYYFGNSNLEDKAVLVVFNPSAFLEDLNLHIKSAIKSYRCRLTQKHFYPSSSVFTDNYILAQNVKYCSFYENDTFNIENDTLDEMFCKSMRYKNQSEARIIIPNINFKERLEDIDNYNYHQNELPVNLSKLQSYAHIYKINELPILKIYDDYLLNIAYWRKIKKV